jgi:hypothetical protein
LTFSSSFPLTPRVFTKESISALGYIFKIKNGVSGKPFLEKKETPFFSAKKATRFS